MESEEVLVVSNRLLADVVKNKKCHLISMDKEKVFQFILENYIFMERQEAEYNYNYKQVIPYIILNHDRDFLLLKRTKKQTEKRLHDKYSLGIGGHINPSQSDKYENIIMEGLYKELNEEIHCPDLNEFSFKGILYDDSTSVSQVHLGLVFEAVLNTPEFEILEPHKMTAAWIARERLREYYDGFESWSKIIFDQYIINLNYS
ncbi:MAG: hypothetical protein JW755_03665 [Candidatus Aminicenantes bacterium]|nr:hypothetical protein [Candidatus Aminicenantes bacterium]